MEKLQNLMNNIRTWSDGQFGELRPPTTMLNHLKKEVPELIEAIKDYQKNNSAFSSNPNDYLSKVFFEYADCFMLLLDSASHFGITADALMNYTEHKLEINKNRKWGEPDENGVVEHIKE